MTTLAAVWSPEQLTFMVWLAMPDTERVPKQQKQLAVELGFSEQTLSEWKRIPGFGDEVYKLARELLKSSWLARILETQAKKAVFAGDTQAARFVFETLGLMGNGKGEDGPKAIATVVNIIRNTPDLRI